MKTSYKIFLSLGIVAALALILGAFLPWKILAAQKLQTVLEANGLKDAHLTVVDLNLHSVVLRDIAIGKDKPLTLENMSILYSPLGLWQRTAGSEVTLNANNFAFNSQTLKGSVGKASVYAKISGQGPYWDGTWNIQDINLVTDAADMPAIAGDGSLRTDDNNFLLDGKLQSKDGAFRTVFQFEVPLTSSKNARLTLTSVSVPWKGGKLSAQNVLVPFGGNQPVKFSLQIQGVSVDALIQALTGNRVSATGAVSGILPLVIGKDGSISFGEGNLQATGPGTLNMPPDAIPGDNEQVSVVRQILKNFHYKDLAISISNNKGNQLSLLVALQGNNPDMYNGRPVKLNVRLAGDVLGYIRQNVLFLTDPKTMLNQGRK